MKVKDQVDFYDAIWGMEIDSLEKIREFLLDKKMTNDSVDKLNMVNIAIESKQKSRRYHEKL